VRGRRTIAFLFPGQGSQYVGMARWLAESHPAAAAVVRGASAALGLDVEDLLFRGPEDRLTLTEFAQPAILTASLAVAAVLTERGIVATHAAGHSLGEYSALAYAGGMGPGEAALLVRRRGELMARAVPPGQGAMAAILGLTAGEVDRVCADAGGEVDPANYNAPGQVVISGRAADVARAGELARERGAKRVVPLVVSGPFHSRLMSPVVPLLRREIEGAGIRDAGLPLVSNVDAAIHLDATEVKDLLARQVASPVRWEESVRLLAARGVTDMVEVGPRNVLAGLVRRIVPEVAVHTTDTPEELEKLTMTLREE
jgi:[acyl-carrier-protein] S-malonyltransferase